MSRTIAWVGLFWACLGLSASMYGFPLPLPAHRSRAHEAASGDERRLPVRDRPAEPAAAPASREAPLPQPFHYDARPADGREGPEGDPVLGGDDAHRRV